MSSKYIHGIIRCEVFGDVHVGMGIESVHSEENFSPLVVVFANSIKEKKL